MVATRKIQTKREGVAATEFALVLPIILILAFGTIEASSALFLRESVAIASYEGARVAVRKRSTTEDVQKVVMEFLAIRGIQPVGLSPSEMVVCSSPPESTVELKPITVKVRVKMNGNGILPNSFYTWFDAAEIRAQTTMYKEFIHPDLEAALAAGK